MGKGQIRTIKGAFTKEQLEAVLGEPSWEWSTVKDSEPRCRLAPGIFPSAGWGSISACCRIWIHEDGICIGPGLEIAEDISYAEEVYQILIKEII